MTQTALRSNTRGRLVVLIVVISLIHLGLLLGIFQSLGDLLFQTERDKSPPMAVSMLPPPSLATPPRVPPAAVPPPTPAFVPNEAVPPAKAAAPASSDQPVDFSGRAPSADEIPRSGAIAVAAYWGDYDKGAPIANGRIEILFPEPDRYEIRLVTHAQGWAKIFASKPLYARTEGFLGPGGFKPQRYTHKSPRDREELQEFDYEKEKISYLSLKKSYPLLKGTQDRLSFMLQLAWMLKVSPEKFGLGESVVLPMAGRKEVEEVTFMVMSDSPVVLPGGILAPAIHLSTHRSGDRFSGQIDVWLDRTDRLLPIRIRFEETRGQVLDLIAIRQP